MHKIKKYSFSLSALISGLIVLLVCSSCQKPEATEPGLGEMRMSVSCESLALEAGQTVGVDVVIAGPGAVDVTLSCEAPEGWSATPQKLENTAEGALRYCVNVITPEFTSSGELLIEAVNRAGEMVSEVVALSSRGIDVTPDPYSTPESTKTVIIEFAGKSQIAFNVKFRKGSNVKKYYYGLMTRREADKYEFFGGEGWQNTIKTGLINDLNKMSVDPWIYNDSFRRFGDIDEPLEPNSEYYVYVVAQLNNGKYSDFEMTRIITLPKFERDPEIPGPTNVTVSDIYKDYNAFGATLASSAAVYSYVYALVDESVVEQYKQLFGNKWDDGYLDMKKYTYTYVQPEKRVSGRHIYEWPNLKPDTGYYLLVIWFDRDDQAHLEMYSFATDAKPAVVGKPSVSFTRTEFTATTATYSFVPNEDCGLYTVDVWSKGDIETFSALYADQWAQKLIEYARRYGGVLEGENTVTLDINRFYPMADEQTRYWTDDTYMLVIMPFDKNGTYDENAITYTHIK